MRTAVVGHVEWIQFLRVPRAPSPGEIVHATEAWEEPAGGGAGAAMQLEKLNHDTIFFTAVGDDALGRRALEWFEGTGLKVEAGLRDEPTRRGVTHIDAEGERTITVIGERHHPRGDDPLPWELLGDVDAVYVTAADESALQHARRAKVVVATARILPLLQRAKVQLDALVASAVDPDESYLEGSLDPVPRLVVRTMGARGGVIEAPGTEPRHFPAAPVPGVISDRYGAGDSFAAALAFALGRGDSALDAAGFAARCGAAVLTGRGPYEGQLRLEDVAPS